MNVIRTIIIIILRKIIFNRSVNQKKKWKPIDD